MSPEITHCRACGHRDLVEILDLGETPLANALRSEKELSQQEAIYPLRLLLCPACSLVQISETVPPEMLFSDYPYFSSYSDTMLAHAKSLASAIIEERNLSTSSRVVEIASNDGYLLQYYKQHNIPVHGIEPAENVANVAIEQHGIPTTVAFFNPEVAEQVSSTLGKADVIHAHNVLAHVADLNGFVEGFRLLLKPDGIAVIEAPYLKPLLDRLEFDTIYHEHLCYFSLTALQRLFRSHELALLRVEQVPIHGGSLRLVVGHAKNVVPDRSVRQLLLEESEWGVDQPQSYKAFSDGVWELKDTLTSLLQELKAKGKQLAAYGAAAKGSTLLNVFGIGENLLDFVVDRSPHKQGLYMPGQTLPILPPETLQTRNPDYVLLLTWNFASEIIRQQESFLRNGGHFILPVPTPRIIEYGTGVQL